MTLLTPYRVVKPGVRIHRREIYRFCIVEAHVQFMQKSKVRSFPGHARITKPQSCCSLITESQFPKEFPHVVLEVTDGLPYTKGELS